MHPDALVDIPRFPVNSLHFRITPPRQVGRLAELDPADVEAVLASYRWLARTLRGRGCTGFNMLVNDGRFEREEIGEIADENPYVQFHVLGRRPDEPLAPMTVLNAPDEFPPEEVSDAERTSRLRTLRAEGRGLEARPPAAAVVSAVPPDCAFCPPASDQETELVRSELGRVISPWHQIVPTHVMLSPWRHVEHVEELTPAEATDLFGLYVQVAKTFGQVNGSTSFNLFVNDGKLAGQHVPHVHVHLFGRSETEETNPYLLLRGLRYRVVK